MATWRLVTNDGVLNQGAFQQHLIKHPIGISTFVTPCYRWRFSRWVWYNLWIKLIWLISFLHTLFPHCIYYCNQSFSQPSYPICSEFSYCGFYCYWNTLFLYCDPAVLVRNIIDRETITIGNLMCAVASELNTYFSNMPSPDRFAKVEINRMTLGTKLLCYDRFGMLEIGILPFYQIKDTPGRLWNLC